MKIFKTFIFALILSSILPFSSFANQSVEEIIKGRKAMFSENYQNAKKSENNCRFWWRWIPR